MFRTEVLVPSSEIEISHESSLLTIGSCFSDNIGELLEKDKFNVLVNPFGTIFNPISIFRVLQYAVDRTSPVEEGFVEFSGIHNHSDFHSKFGSQTTSQLNDSLNKTIEDVHGHLKSTDVLIITFGTAVVYEYMKSAKIVANCHKIPQKEFKKYTLSIDDILASFESLNDSLKKFNPGLKVILAVSPVRHIKDTLVLNSVSKSILRTACHMLQKNNANIEYFPSYEIIMDDLRDYRFYKSDMIHPNETAVSYIYEKFATTHFSNETQKTLTDWRSIRQSLNHKPFNVQSIAHQQFISETLVKLDRFSNKFDVSEEILKLKSQLI